MGKWSWLGAQSGSASRTLVSRVPFLPQPQAPPHRHVVGHPALLVTRTDRTSLGEMELPSMSCSPSGACLLLLLETSSLWGPGESGDIFRQNLNCVYPLPSTFSPACREKHMTE